MCVPILIIFYPDNALAYYNFVHFNAYDSYPKLKMEYRDSSKDKISS